MTAVFLNGEFVDRADARVSAFDAGFQHAVGLFETMTGVRTAGGETRIIGLIEHCERLVESARQLRLSDDMRADRLADACVETMEKSGLDRARIRMTVSGGDLNMLECSGASNVSPTLLILAQPATEYPAEMFERGVGLTIADAKANPLDPFQGHKTLNYWWRLRELQNAAAKGAGEALVLQVSNHICGGCVSNLIAIHGDRALTPIAGGEEAEGGVPSPVLPGVARSFVLSWLEEMGLEVSRQMMSIDDVLDADEVVLTNSGWGVLPVVRVEAGMIREGRPGTVSEGLVGRWGELKEG
ncbi:MAG: aminotransferase class IV [Planctomycetota bacterium]